MISIDVSFLGTSCLVIHNQCVFVAIFLPIAALTLDIGSSSLADANLRRFLGPLFLGHRQAALTQEITPETSFHIYQVLQSAVFLTNSLPIYADKPCPLRAVLAAVLSVPCVLRIIF